MELIAVRHLPCTIVEAMSSMTDREFQTWKYWLRERWNRPSRTDHYLMQIAYEVAHVLSTSRSGSIDSMKLSFSATQDLSKEELESHKLAKLKLTKSQAIARVMRHGRGSRTSTTRRPPVR